MDDALTTDRLNVVPWLGEAREQGDEAPALVVVWFHEEPERLGQVVPIAAGGSWVGRAREAVNGRPPVAPLIEQRPGRNRVMPPIETPWISRHHLYLKPRDEGTLEVTNHGKCELFHNGRPVGEGCVAREGDTLLVENLVMFLVESRPGTLAPRNYLPDPGFAFGAPDAHGIVGESPAIWALRDHVAAVARYDAHVLVRGPTGAGKALVAAAIHALSSRSGGRCEVRNAAAIPPGLLDAELFGSARDYQSAVRLVAVTNCETSELENDFVARFLGRIVVAGLAARRSDIPLLVRHYLGTRTGDMSNEVLRFLRDGDPARPVIDPALIDALVRHDYIENTRELFRVLGTALDSSVGDYIGFTARTREELAAAGPAPAEGGPGDTLPAATLPSAEALAAATAVLLAADARAPRAAVSSTTPPALSGAPRAAVSSVAPNDSVRHHSTLPPPRPAERVSREQALAALDAEQSNITRAARRFGLTRESFKRRLVKLGVREKG